MAELRNQAGVAARCLELTILTATRTSEARGAKWSEIDLQARTWTIPAERIKAGKAHVVPLSDRALELLAAMLRSGDSVFWSSHASKPIGVMGMSVILQRMGCDGTVHGFRSSFRDWADEQTGYPDHVVEKALAHAISDKVEAAYRRSALLQKRRELMDDWARYCSGAIPGAGVSLPY
jgi:integrase